MAVASTGTGKTASRVLTGAASLGVSGPHIVFNGHVALYDNDQHEYILPNGERSSVPMSQEEYTTNCVNNNSMNDVLASMTKQSTSDMMMITPYNTKNPSKCIRFHRITPPKDETDWISNIRDLVYIPFAQHYFGETHTEDRKQLFKFVNRIRTMPVTAMCVIHAFSTLEENPGKNYTLHVGTLDVHTNKGWVEHFGGEEDGTVSISRY